MPELRNAPSLMLVMFCGTVKVVSAEHL